MHSIQQRAVCTHCALVPFLITHSPTRRPTDPSTRVGQVHTINPEKKTFDRIDRLAARAETFEMELLIDINSELWPVAADDKVIIMCLPVMSSRKMLRRAPNA